MYNNYGQYSYDRPIRNGYNWGTRAPYNPQYPGSRTSQYQQRQAPRKHSGCRYTQGSNGKPVLTGWNKRKGRFTTFVATLNNPKNVTRKDGSAIINKKGQEYARWTATITDHSSMSESTVSCLYNTATGKLYFPSFNLVANPKAANGGYWGRCVSKNRR